MTEPYGSFAEIYDAVMRHVPYDRWAEYVERILDRFDHRPRSVVDLGCGTGSMTLPWARKGLWTAGVDRSPSMLERARARAAAENLTVLLLEQDMTRLELPGTVDLALCLYDTVNHIMNPDELARFFRAVQRHLEPLGLFVFDINSHHKLSGVRSDTFHMEGDGFHLIWEQDYRPTERVWAVDLTGFLECEDGRYRRFREEHRERAYHVREIQRLLASSGLESLACWRAYSFERARPTDDRYYFVTRKEGKACC